VLEPAVLAGGRNEPATRSRVVASDTAPRRGACGSVVARFSTGEVVTLHGTGLIGRNPAPQEGERFDALVRIHDPGRSVSKTHLEFVVDAGRLWIRDRFSGNGTILRHPNGTGSRCEAGRRHRVEDGDRVEIGEQFFDIR
jgi:pSer/pThr/pTyr-binding forkhead associated (FHA) protein